MEKAKLEHHFPFDFETLVELRENRYKHLDIWDTFSAAHLTAEKTEKGVRIRNYKLMIRTSLPLFAQKLLQKGEGLSVLETTWFNAKERTYKAEAVLSLVNAAIGFKETSHYLPDGANSKRNIEIVANVKIPAIGKPIQKIIVHEFREQSEVDKERIIDFWEKNLKSKK